MKFSLFSEVWLILLVCDRWARLLALTSLLVRTPPCPTSWDTDWTSTWPGEQTEKHLSGYAAFHHIQWSFAHCSFQHSLLHGRLEEIGASAAKEYSLEKAMAKMKTEWAPLYFELVPYRDTVSAALLVFVSVCSLMVYSCFRKQGVIVQFTEWNVPELEFMFFTIKNWHNTREPFSDFLWKEYSLAMDRNKSAVGLCW